MRTSVLMLLWAMLGVGAAQAGDLAKAERARIDAGLKMAPVPLRYDKSKREMVGRGSYLLNALGACAECHSPGFNPFAEGANPFKGEPERIDPSRYLVGGTNMEGFVSRNLRPDHEGRPGGLTLEQFMEVMRHGKDFKPELGPPETPTLQLMPWAFYTHMTDIDLHAIYEYLKALPALDEMAAAALQGESEPSD